MQKLLLLDNNDSFTYNIVDYLRRMDAVDIEVISTEKANLNQTKNFDKVIISPGPGLPDDFPFIFHFLGKYYTSKPILGICLGHQAISKFFGAKLIHISPVIHGQTSANTITEKTQIFKDIPQFFKVGLYHSWAVDSTNFPKNLKITSVSQNNIIMSVEVENFPIFGVQFHPESYITEYGFEILKNFIDLGKS